MENYFQDVDETTLIAFDVDQTLIVARDALFYDPDAEEFLFDFVKKHKAGGKNITAFGSIVYTSLNPRLLDPSVPQFIHTLKSKKPKVLALTAMNTGSYGEIPSLQELRFYQLLELGIRFDDSSFTNFYEFPEYGSLNDMPLFHRGVLFSAGTPKGQVLLAFLKKADFKPNKVIFVDDKKSWVEEMENSLNAQGIDNLCIHLRQIEKFGKFDPAVAEYQLNTLIREKKWLSDEEAKTCLSNS
jgi:hypothetical protein